jgi:hypothetical protein
MEGETGAGACEGRGRSWSGAPPAEISWCVQVWREGMRRERLERNMERLFEKKPQGGPRHTTSQSKRCDDRHSYSHTKNAPDNRPQVIDHRWQLQRKTEWTTKMLQNPKTYPEKS